MGHHNKSRSFPGPGNKADCVRIPLRGPVACQRADGHNKSRTFPGPGNKADCVRILWRGPVARQRLLWGPMKGLHGAPQHIPFFSGAGKQRGLRPDVVVCSGGSPAALVGADGGASWETQTSRFFPGAGKQGGLRQDAVSWSGGLPAALMRADEGHSRSTTTNLGEFPGAGKQGGVRPDAVAWSGGLPAALMRADERHSRSTTTNPGEFHGAGNQGGLRPDAEAWSGGWPAALVRADEGPSWGTTTNPGLSRGRETRRGASRTLWLGPVACQRQRTGVRTQPALFPGPGKVRDLLLRPMKNLHRPPQEPLASHRTAHRCPDAIRLVSRPRESPGFVVVPHEGPSSALTRAAAEPPDRAILSRR